MIVSIEEGRKEDGNIAIAEKIIKRLHDLDKTVKNNQGRWAWELLQNAKDSIADEEDRKISIQIEFSANYVEFRHNGSHFTEKDIRGLINQISSKDSEDENVVTKKTGRFGTGFLTTHLLSKTVNVKGILKANDSKYYTFEFPLDRDARKPQQLIVKIDAAWAGFNSSTKELSSQIKHVDYNTTFGYVLNNPEQREIAKIGIKEFIELVPFVLAFIPKIECIELISNASKRTIKFNNTDARIEGFIAPIKKLEDNIEEVIHIAVVSDEYISIAAKLLKTDTCYKVLPNRELPKLFCDFPLIGSENFHFPVIINSFHFHPQTERDGLWLLGKEDGSDKDVNENQQLIERSFNLYKTLIPRLENPQYTDLYNISNSELPEVDHKYFDSEWFSSKIQTPLREYLLEAYLVESINGQEKKQLKNIYFPLKSHTNTIQDELWQNFYDLYPDNVCKKDQISQWSEVYWHACNKINYNNIAIAIEEQKDIFNLATKLNLSEGDAMAWLNNACEFIYRDESNLSLFSKHNLTPNQNGIFLKKADLFIDKIDDSTFLQIMILLGGDWKAFLLDKRVTYGEYQVKDKQAIANKITEKLRNPTDSIDVKRAIILLSEWFEVNNPDESKKLFSELYKQRAELFMYTVTDKESLYKVMRSGANITELSKLAETLARNPELAEDITGAAHLSSLFNEFGIASIEELQQILRKYNSRETFEKPEITSELLASLGITNEDELEEALKDKDLAALFNHKSKPNIDMFLYAQSLISRAKQNILSHLQKLDEYDCTDAEMIATSVIGGIKKQGLEITIVVRPSDFGQVIVYYSSEKDSLDYVNAELWIENGRDLPRHLTLGKILKTTGINKIPV